MLARATMTTKGQITIPQAVRDGLDLKPGDRVEFEILPDGSFRGARVSQGLDALVGRLARYATSTPVGPDDIAAARLAEYAARGALG
jgi:antitoxin PrlF